MILRQAFKLVRPVRDRCRHEVHHAFLAALHLAFDHHQPRCHDGAALPFEQARPQ